MSAPRTTSSTRSIADSRRAKSSLRRRSPRRRGGTLALTLITLGVLSLSAAGVLSFTGGGVGPLSSGSPGSTGGGAGTGAAGTKLALATKPAPAAKPAAAKKLTLQPGEVAVALHMIGISPESLAASGGTANDCASLFSAAGVYCLGTDVLSAMQAAYANLNKAKNKAVHFEADAPLDGNGQPIAVADAQTTVDNLISEAFTGCTGTLDAGIVTKLSAIKANAAWGIPAPYLTVNHSGDDWLALRGALVARNFANSHNTDVPDAPAEVLSTDEGDTTVAHALTDYTTNLAGIKEVWLAHETTAP